MGTAESLNSKHHAVAELELEPVRAFGVLVAEEQAEGSLVAPAAAESSH